MATDGSAKEYFRIKKVAADLIQQVIFDNLIQIDESMLTRIPADQVVRVGEKEVQRFNDVVWQVALPDQILLTQEGEQLEKLLRGCVSSDNPNPDESIQLSPDLLKSLAGMAVPFLVRSAPDDLMEKLENAVSLDSHSVSKVSEFVKKAFADALQASAQKSLSAVAGGFLNGFLNGSKLLIALEPIGDARANLVHTLMTRASFGYIEQIPELRELQFQNEMSQYNENRGKNTDSAGDAPHLTKGPRIPDRYFPFISIAVFLDPGRNWTPLVSIHDSLFDHFPLILSHTSDFSCIVVVPKKMDEGDFRKFGTDLGDVLRALKAGGRKEELNRVLQNERYKTLSVAGARLLRDAIGAKFVIPDNVEGGGSYNMCGAMQELRDEVKQEMRDEIEQATQAAQEAQEEQLDSIRSLMKRLGETAETVMDMMSLSPEKQKRYLPLL